MASGVSETNEAQRHRGLFLCVCRAEIMSGGLPRPAPPAVASTLYSIWLFECKFEPIYL